MPSKIIIKTFFILNFFMYLRNNNQNKFKFSIYKNNKKYIFLFFFLK